MRFFFLSFIAAILAACTSPAIPAPIIAPTIVPTTTPAAPAIAYLALGDSYTIGEGAAVADRWPVQLAGLLHQQGTPVTDPDIIARTGWTTAELQSAIAASGNTRTDYGLVSLLIGVNNQYRGQSVDQYRTEFRQLLGTAKQYAGGRAGRVVVLSIPDWGQSPYAAGGDRARIGQQIDQFNAVAQQECQQAGVAYVDVTPITRSASSDPTQFTADGLHYTGAQMRRWAVAALPVVQGLLK